MFRTYTITEFLNHQESKERIHFHVSKLENLPNLSNPSITPKRNHFYELYLITNGTASLKVDYEVFELKPNSFFFIAQGQIHFWETTSLELVQGYRIMFSEDFFKINQPDNHVLFDLVYFDNAQQHLFMPLRKGKHNLIFTYFDLLNKEFQRSESAEKALQSLLYLLLLEVQRDMPEKATLSQQSNIFKKFINLLEKNYQDKWTARDYAKALHISPRHLNRIVQATAKQNLTSIILDRVILEAKRLLVYSDLTVSEIALRLGYEDSAYFARSFRKKTNVSPTDFRKNKTLRLS